MTTYPSLLKIARERRQANPDQPSIITVRMKAEQHERYRLAAHAAGMSMNEWCVMVMDEASRQEATA